MNNGGAWRQAGMALVVAFALFYIATLGIRPLARTDEFRYAEIGREMLDSGDWVTPRFNGVRYFEKPVLGHWLNAVSQAAFGENAFAVRLPSALATGLTALFMFGFLRRLAAPPGLALGASGILLSCLAVWGCGGIAILDPILTLWLTLSVGLYYLAYVAPAGRHRRVLQALVGVCCGLAFLTKGFLALAVPVLIVVPFLAWQRDWARLLDDAWLPILVAVAVILPWGLLIHGREPDFWRYFFWEEHIRRFFSEDAQHERPFLMFIAVLPAMALPWTFYAPAAVTGLRHASLDRRLLRFAALWFLMPLLFFSASRGKLLPYILPCFPPLALLLAYGITGYRDSGRWVALRRGALGLAIVFGAGFAVLLANGLGGLGRPVFGAAETTRWALALAALAWGAVMAVRAARHAASGAAWTLGIAMLGLFLAIPFVVPDSTRDGKMPGEFLARERSVIAPNAVLIVEGGLAGSVSWVFQRSDLYVFDPGELKYGLSQPDASYRLLDAAGIGALIQANTDRRDVVIVTWTDREDRLLSYVPSTARRARQGKVTLWQVTAPQGP